MEYLDRIKSAFETVIGTAAASTITAEADMESVPGWDSQSFIPLILALENEFSIEIPTIDAVSLFSVSSIDQYLSRKLYNAR